MSAPNTSKESAFGFSKSGNEEEANYNKMKSKLQDEIGNAFKPEFLNRIDDTIIFKPLTKESNRKIVDIMIKDLKQRLDDNDIYITVKENVKDFLVDQGFNQKQGARPLRRAIQEHFEDTLADKLLEKT